MATEASIALTNRSLRTIRTVCNHLTTHLPDHQANSVQELEFLCDTNVISSEQLSSILAQLPAQTPLHAPLHGQANGATNTPVDQFSNMALKEGYVPIPTPAPLPPPAYVPPPILAIASALYAYNPTDTGDLALQLGDQITVLEHMNNDCMCADDARCQCYANFLQGGEAVMSAPTSKASSHEATSM